MLYEFNSSGLRMNRAKYLESELRLLSLFCFGLFCHMLVIV